MGLSVDEATRIVQFCLAGDGWGKATYDEDRPTISLLVHAGERTERREFQAETFEGALDAAVAAGVLKGPAVAKQITFLQRTTPRAGRLNGSPAEPPKFHEATAILSALIHETQRERGVSSLYAASGGRVFREEMPLQWQTTDRRHAELTVLRERFADRLPASVVSRLVSAEDLFSEVIASRPAIEKLKIRPPELIAAYSALNREFLEVVDAMLPMVTEPAQRPTALAWIALLNAKEKTGVERAQLVSAFQRDRYVDGQYQSLLGLIAARDSYLHLFADAAPASARELLHEQLASEVATTVQRMEQIALDRRRGGFGVDPTDWFAAISAQIDRLGALESAVLSSLAAPVRQSP
ncbi:MAG TPA: nitrate- and nitrite sensing domain-containing protein [Polyangia bacterium]|nr:nitrate- and nitrite sensing domain-containing protein [Polyangia bacterium]